MAKLNIKKGDLVKLISGSKLERGKTGRVLQVFPETQRVIVEGINLVTRHVRESQGADGRRVEGGRITTEAPVHISNDAASTCPGNRRQPAAARTAGPTVLRGWKARKLKPRTVSVLIRATSSSSPISTGPFPVHA